MMRRLCKMLETVLPAFAGEPTLDDPVSQACTQAQFDDPIYAYWCHQIGEPPRIHRKQWEFCYIMQALDKYDMLRPGFSGLGFGVGLEPLPAAFAARGISILATDLEPQRAVTKGWTATEQHASDKAQLNCRGLCEDAAFERLVDHRYMDMTAIDADLAGQFDFCWSACAFEHLGSIAKGLEFVERSIDCLKPGGIAVHTTELNCSSNLATLDHASTVLFRKRDFRKLAQRLRAKGYRLAFNFNLGRKPLDKYIDVPPYRVDVHLKAQIEKWTTTSFGILAVPISVPDPAPPSQEPDGAPILARPVSQACTQAQMEEPVHAQWCEKVGETPRLHRKQWEFSYILQALHTCDMLRPGRSGLGLQVGMEPLAAAIAAHGVKVLATDPAPHMAGTGAVNDRGLCDPQSFAQLVDFRRMDTSEFDPDLAGKFDFCWSSGAAHQLGSIANGLHFIERTVDCLKPGGVAVHTTEFNCFSDAMTFDRASTVLFRRRDFRKLARRLREKGYGLTLNFNLGDQPFDKDVDVPPYRMDPHLKLRVADWTSTSFGLLVYPLSSQGRG